MDQLNDIDQTLLTKDCRDAITRLKARANVFGVQLAKKERIYELNNKFDKTYKHFFQSLITI